MARKKKSTLVAPTHVNCPFKILIDTNEQLPYSFDGMLSNSDNGNLPYAITTEKRHLNYLGDYSLAHLDDESAEKYGPMPKCIIERKSKSDFFGSMADRKNFEERVARLAEEVEYAAVVVEAEWYEMFTDPPKWRGKGGVMMESRMSPTAIHRTVQSWTIEYSNVHWFFYPGRDAAESATFQLLFRFWEKLKKKQTDRHRKTENYRIYHDGMRARYKRLPIEENPYPRAKHVGDDGDWWNRGYIDMSDIMSEKTNGRTKCSEPPRFPDQIFARDFSHEK